MKSKIVLFCFFVLLLGFHSKAQLIQGTIRSGTNDSIEVWIKPNFSNNTQYLFQLSFPLAFPATAIQLPTTLNCKLSPLFIAAFGDNYSITVNPVANNTVNAEKYFNIVLVRTGIGASNPQIWNSGAEYKVLATEFIPSGSPGTQIKLADYQDGGSDGQGNFYTMDGNANYYVATNSAANFYASIGLSIAGGTSSEGFAQTIGSVPCTPPIVQPIAGQQVVQFGQTAQLTNSAAGGTWSSDAPGIATVNSTGLVTGLAPGNVVIHYQVNNACGTTDVTTTITVEQKLIAGSIRKGSANDEIEIWLKPYFSNNTQYLFQIGLPIAFPAGISPSPVIPTVADITLDNTFKTTFGDNYSVFVNPVAQNGTGTENYFNIVLIRNQVNASSAQIWTAGAEYKVLTIKFTNPGGISQVKLADYQGGASDGQGNFYTMDGNANYYVTDNSVSNFFAIPGESQIGGVAAAGYAQTISAVAPVCTDPLIPKVTVSSSSEALIAWDPVNGSIGYEYMISSIPGLPASGIPTTSTSHNATGLLPGTKYYAYLRSSCLPGIFSNWVVKEFITLCPTNTTAVAGNITMTSAVINWQSILGVSGYQITVNTNPNPPVNAPATTTSITFNPTGLIAGTTYYIYIRTVCSSGNFSEWTRAEFITEYPPCGPTFISAVTNITSAASINWTALNGVSGYEYSVTTSSIPPSIGTPTTFNSYQATGLNSATQYYAHVRVVCGPGRNSTWVTRPFVTPCFKPSLFIASPASNAGAIDLGWRKINNVLKYEYAILANEVSPSGSSSSTSDTMVHLTNLKPGGKYYLHVRTYCELGTISPWSVIEFHTAGVDISPNPATNKITISVYGDNAGNGQIVIINAAGQVMRKTNLTSTNMVIDVSSYAAGLYFIRYLYNNKRYVAQLVKY